MQVARYRGDFYKYMEFARCGKMFRWRNGDYLLSVRKSAHIRPPMTSLVNFRRLEFWTNDKSSAHGLLSITIKCRAIGAAEINTTSLEFAAKNSDRVDVFLAAQGSRGDIPVKTHDGRRRGNSLQIFGRPSECGRAAPTTQFARHTGRGNW